MCVCSKNPSICCLLGLKEALKVFVNTIWPSVWSSGKSGELWAIRDRKEGNEVKGRGIEGGRSRCSCRNETEMFHRTE